jgi:hypothetical protein
MGTKRTPKHAAAKQRITPAAVEAFRQMVQAHDDCTCEDWSCEFCKQASDLKWTIHCELKLRPWESIERPDSVCPYPASTGGAQDWPAAQQRWRELEAAADASV